MSDGAVAERSEGKEQGDRIAAISENLNSMASISSRGERGGVWGGGDLVANDTAARGGGVGRGSLSVDREVGGVNFASLDVGRFKGTVAPGNKSGFPSTLWATATKRRHQRFHGDHLRLEINLRLISD